jgi:predicted nucleotidyltransferase
MAFRNAVVQAYPNAVQDVVLFGSRARGDTSADSDYDVAVVLAANVAIDRELRRRLADAAWEHVIDGYAIIPIAMEAHTLADDCPTRTELGARITAEGISVR